jgi:hypothetical protein
MRECRLLLTVLLGLSMAPGADGLRAQPGPLNLELTLNRTSIVPGQRLVAGISVNNPGGGPAADFVFAVVLPGGVTVASVGPGIGVRFGRFSDLRTIVPVARNVSLAGPFQYADPGFFAYDFAGAEPFGTYRFIFAAVTAGALNDGALGAGELLAVRMTDVTLSASGVVVDPLRTATVMVTPAGGTVQTTAADGTVLALTVPPNSVKTPTAISITPLVAFDNAPTGRLVAGIRAEPSGLYFDPPLTLTITLPPGFQPPAFGVSGLLADDNGQNAQPVSATLAGNVVTLQVPHFSLAAVTFLDGWLFECTPALSAQHAAACQQLQPLYAAELARIAAAGGGIGTAFKDSVLPILQTWMQGSILPRLADAQLPGAPDPQVKPEGALEELSVWLWVYRPVFGEVSDRGNAGGGLPLGALIDQAQSEARLTFIAGMNANNIKCLADKPQVSRYVSNILYLLVSWSFGVPFGAERPAMNYCVDLHIDAAAPPVLTPGQPSLMPVDVRVRFTDDTELPGVDVSLAITATDATVAPAGGVVTTPLENNVTVTPVGTTSTVTITGTFVDTPPFAEFIALPARTRTFQAGQGGTTDLAVTRSSLEAFVQADLPTRPGLRNADTKSTFATMQSVSVAMDEQVTSSGSLFRSTSLSTATRNVSGAGSVATVAGSLRAEPQLSVQPPVPGVSGSSAAGSLQSVCFNLPRPYNAAYAVLGNHQNASDRFNVNLAIIAGGTNINAYAGDSGSGALPMGEACIGFSAVWACTLSTTPTGAVCQIPNPLLGSYTVNLTPKP